MSEVEKNLALMNERYSALRASHKELITGLKQLHSLYSSQNLPLRWVRELIQQAQKVSAR